MSHIIDYCIFDKKEDILPGADNFAFYNTDREENLSGDYHGNLTFHNEICNNYEDALEKIDQWDTGHYSDHAVRFREYEELPKTKRIQTLEGRMERNRKEKDEYYEKHKIQTLKAKLITCPKCESKIAKDYLHNAYSDQLCPVCHTDLRAEYIQDRLTKYDTDYEELEKTLKQEERNLQQKMQKKTKIKWVAKFEIHC